ncbi:MAG: hypothetical protein HYZ22_09915 [Chloroflexi bacterium]|nr:hypothetical protein [Chloroflexota bacterium]
MTIRPLDLLDLPTIARYRNDVLTLDSTRALTRGHPLGAMGLLAYVNPARHLYAAVKSGDVTLLGGIIHTRGEPYAKLLYLAPSFNLNNPHLPELIEHLTVQAGAWQAFHVIAEVDETSDVFMALRKAGFAVYAWQRVWDASQIQKTESSLGREWKRVKSIDLPAVQRMHYQIVPQLLHPVDPAPRLPNGFIHSDERCFANVSYGVYGVVLTPWILPDEEDVSGKIVSLLASLPDRRGRPVYLNVRSYQAWLEPVLADLGAKASPRQAVMVKYLARLVKEGVPARVVPSNARVQPTQISRMDTDE